MTTIQGIHSIPTMYRGVQFRSRLEARWAAFFDQLQWKWEYEPCDFKGWIPDFLLHGAMRVFVEVKPVEEFPRNIADEIDRSGCEDECLIVGRCPLFNEDQYYSHAVLGWLRESYELWPENHDASMVSCDAEGVLHCEGSTIEWVWERACFGQWSDDNPNGLVGFCHGEGAFIDRITGGYDGGCYGEGIPDLLDARVSAAWIAAGNAVQWKGPSR